jgi:uncharacterized protein GlcG (DUF336 family)
MSDTTMHDTLALRICCIGALIGAVALARAAAPTPFHDKPASPQSLPGDTLPPFAMLDAHGKLIPTPAIPAGALHRGPGTPPESTARGPSLSQAVAVAHAAVDACAAAGYRVGVTVIDSAGEARAMLTADGSDGSHVFVAMRKALTALAFQAPSSQAQKMLQADAALLARVTPAMFVEGGAIPLRVGSEVVGAVGVSGAGGSVIGQQDEVCALAGVRAIEPRLK